jgi:hypothetical protein
MEDAGFTGFPKLAITTGLATGNNYVSTSAGFSVEELEEMEREALEAEAETQAMEDAGFTGFPKF